MLKKQFLRNNAREVNGRNMSNGGDKTHIELINTASKYERMTELIQSCLPTPTCCYLFLLFLFIISQRLETRPCNCFPFLKCDYCGFFGDEMTLNIYFCLKSRDSSWRSALLGWMPVWWDSSSGQSVLSEALRKASRCCSLFLFKVNEWMKAARVVVVAAAACCLSYLGVNTNAHTRPCCPSAFPGLQGVCCPCLSEGVLPSHQFGPGRRLGHNHLAIEGPVEVDGMCLALACVVTIWPVSVFVECFPLLIPNMPRQIYSSVIKRRIQSFGCLCDLSRQPSMKTNRVSWWKKPSSYIFS